jgi:hypothetical protein
MTPSTRKVDALNEFAIVGEVRIRVSKGYLGDNITDRTSSRESAEVPGIAAMADQMENGLVHNRPKSESLITLVLNSPFSMPFVCSSNFLCKQLFCQSTIEEMAFVPVPPGWKEQLGHMTAREPEG